MTEKEIKKRDNRRKGRPRKIAGWLLIILGFEYIIPLIIGIWLIVKARKDVALWDRYDAAIAGKATVSIDDIASIMGKSSIEVISELNDMINKGFLSGPSGTFNAWIDTDANRLVIDIPNCQNYDMDKSVKMEDMTDRQILFMASELIEDEKARKDLLEMKRVIERIDAMIEKDPSIAQKKHVINLYEKYIPDIAVLLKKLIERECSGDVAEGIYDAISVCKEAFENIEKRIIEGNDIELMGDIAVLRDTLRREGLLGSDFDI